MVALHINSTMLFKKDVFNAKVSYFIPMQLKPSPSKPSMQVQVKLPIVSVQLALALHG